MLSVVSRPTYRPIYSAPEKKYGSEPSGPNDLTLQEISTVVTSVTFYPDLTAGEAITFSAGLSVSVGGAAFSTDGIDPWVDGTSLRYRATTSGSYNTPLTFVTSAEGTPVDALDWIMRTKLAVVYALDPDDETMIDPDGNPVEDF